MKLNSGLLIFSLALAIASQSVAQTVGSTETAAQIQSAISSACQGQGSNEVVVDFPDQGLLNERKLYMKIHCVNGSAVQWDIGARINYSVGSCTDVGIRLQW